MKKNLLILSLPLALGLSACGNKKSSSGYGQPQPPVNTQPQPGGPGSQSPGPNNGGTNNGGINNGGINNGPTPVTNDGGNGAIEPIRNDDSGPRTGGGNLPPGRGGDQGSRDNGRGGRGGVSIPDTDILPPIVPAGGNGSNGGSVTGPTPKPRTPPTPATLEDNLLPWYAPDVKGTPAEAWLYYQIDPLLKSITNAAPLTKTLKSRVQVTLALGYFDGNAKNDFRYEGRNYGRHAAVDPFLRAAVEQVLTRDCKNKRLQLCGFELLSTNDVESFYRREGDGGIIQELRVLSGAYSPYHEENIGRDSKDQLRRSERAEQAFMNAFRSSEAVVYVGHSRKGGGPDFRPPRLKNNEVDYASYAKDRPGAKRTLNAVKDRNRRTRSLALLSCDSTEWFLGEVRKAGPDLELATVKGDLRAEELVAAALANVELFLRQGSLRGVSQFVSGSDRLAKSMDLRLPTRLANH